MSDPIELPPVPEDEEEHAAAPAEAPRTVPPSAPIELPTVPEDDEEATPGAPEAPVASLSAPIELPPIPEDAQGLSSKERAELEGREYEPGEKTMLEMLAAAPPIPGEPGGPVPAAAAAPGVEARIHLVDRREARAPWCRSARVVQAALRRDRELRIFPAGFTDQQAALFFQELRNLSNLDHPGFVPVHDSVVYKGCPCYLVPLREDPTLEDLVEQKDFPLRERARVVRSLAEALAEAHAQEILLGPIPPGRIAWDGAAEQAYYLHLGQAPDDWRDPMLQHTPLYGAREPLTQANDVFAWGLVAFWLLSQGQHAYGAGPEDARRLLSMEPGLAPELALAVQAAVAWDPDLRPQSGGALHSILASEVRDLAVPGEEPPVDLEITEISRRVLAREGDWQKEARRARKRRQAKRAGELEAAFRVPGADGTTDLGKMTQMASRMGLTLLPDEPALPASTRRKVRALRLLAGVLWVAVAAGLAFLVARHLGWW